MILFKGSSLPLLLLETRPAAEKLQNGDIRMLENIRFHPGEKENSEDFARKLEDLAGRAISKCERSEV